MVDEAKGGKANAEKRYLDAAGQVYIMHIIMLRKIFFSQEL